MREGSLRFLRIACPRLSIGEARQEIGILLGCRRRQFELAYGFVESSTGDRHLTPDVGFVGKWGHEGTDLGLSFQRARDGLLRGGSTASHRARKKSQKCGENAGQRARLASAWCAPPRKSDVEVGCAREQNREQKGDAVRGLLNHEFVLPMMPRPWRRGDGRCAFALLFCSRRPARFDKA